MRIFRLKRHFLVINYQNINGNFDIRGDPYVKNEMKKKFINHTHFLR